MGYSVYTDPPKNPKFSSPIQKAISVLNSGIDKLWWATSCFSHEDETAEYKTPEWLKQQRIVERKLTIARLIPALKDVLSHIKDLDYSDYDGFAICSRKDPSHVLSNGAGHCIFATENDAQTMIELWSKAGDHEKEPPEHRKIKIRDAVVIRSVHVSTEHGLAFTDGKDAPVLEPLGLDVLDEDTSEKSSEKCIG